MAHRARPARGAAVGAVLAVGLVGVFLGGVLPTANAWIGTMFPVERRGQVYGVVASATFLGPSAPR